MSNSVNVYTIGFTQTTAEGFFNRLIKAKIQRVIDVRLNNTSQLSGFAKVKDLTFFLRQLAEIDYLHEPLACAEPGYSYGFQKEEGGLGCV